LCPDFVVELRSATDSLAKLQEKMQEYLNNGARLGWLIDPQNQRVEIYRPGQEIQVLEHPAELSGEDVLPGFILNLRRIWQ
jgi:Uma2 family endonuclease